MKPTALYQEPGVEAGLVIVPAVALEALIVGVAVAVIGAPWHGVIAGIAAFITGIAAWFGLWELLVRLHPRFSQRVTAKWRAVMWGPPVLSAVVGVLMAGWLRAG